MREIKFRAWDHSKRKIIMPMREHYMIHNGLLKPQKEYLLLMQYTGLKDVNGLEIYEDDVVKLCGYDLITVVKYDSSKIRFLPYNLDGLEVIGNIHENPELLSDNADNK